MSDHRDYFDALLASGERVCGEWLAMAHGTRYELGNRSLFVAFDIMRGVRREIFDVFLKRIYEVDEFMIDNPVEVPPLLRVGGPCSIEHALAALGDRGRYGATEEAEGVVYRVERNGEVDFLAKYVRPGKVDGKYFDVDVWNWKQVERAK